jgi:hypothetical protein
MSNVAEIRIFNAIKNALKPHGNINLIEWAKKNVPVNNSPKGSHIDFNLTPWFKEPYTEIISNPTLKECNICSPVGSGKSALLIALGVTTVALYPKQLMYVAQNEQMTIDFLDLHLKPSMKKNKTIAKMWPLRNMDRKESIHFPTCSIYTGYATALNTLQSRSIDLLCLDEVWLFDKEGVIEECRRRLHDRPASRMVCVSQGGIIGDQFHKTYSMGLIKKYAWECEDCKSRNIYKFEDLVFDYKKDSNGTPIWSTVYAELKCPCCEKKYEDTIENRRRLAENALYVVEDENQNCLPHHVSYSFNQLCVYDVSWSKLATEFLVANNSNLRSTSLKQFQQKKLGEFYDESKNCQTIDLDSVQGGYAIDDYKYEPLDLRIMTVDVQQSQMFIVIRDWSKQGASQLVAFKYCSTFSEIEKIRVEYNIKPKAVFLDAAYRPEEVKLAGAQYGYIGLNGRGDSLFKIKNDEGKTIERVFSAPVNYQIKTNQGVKTFQVVNYSGVSVKDILSTMQGNDNKMWSIASSGENFNMYIHQLNSEIRDINKHTGKPYYKKVRDNNHAFDCEVMQIVAAMIWKMMVFSEDAVNE